MKIDAHQHFWQYNPQTHDWIGDDMSVLKRDFMPSDLQPQLNACDIAGCIAVQADQSEQETHFLTNLAREHAFIKGVVGWVDLAHEQLEERLAYFSNFSKIVGFRHIVQSEPDNNFMLGDEFKRGIGLLSHYNFTYDILIYPTQMAAAIKITEAFPNQKFVIDHLAKPYIKRGILEPWERHMRSLAERENVFCKISGMVTEADLENWAYEDFVPYLDVVMEAFGPDRLMFGSDWPVCLLAGSYTEVKSIIEKYVSSLSDGEKSKIWGGTAAAFYNLK